MRRLACIAPLFVLLLSQPLPVRAHAGPPTLEQLEVDPSDPTHLIAGTNFGTLVSTDGGLTWGWICREAMRASLDVNDPVVAIADDGTLFVADGAGLWRGTPDGCDWQLADASFSGPMGSLARASAHTLFAGTAFDDAENALYRSTDDGAHWAPAIGPTFRHHYESVAAAPSDPTRVYAVQNLPPERVEPWQPAVFRSDDGGTTWTSVPFALDPAEWHLFVIGVDPSDADRLVLHTQDLHTDGHDRVLTSRDGAQTFDVVETLTQVLAGRWSPDGSAIWIGGPLDGVWRSDDHGATFAPSHAGLDVRGFLIRDGALWVTGTQALDGWAIARSTDRGVTLDALETLSAIRGIASCPPTSAVAMICPSHRATLDSALASVMDAGMPDGGPVDAASSDASSAVDAGPTRVPTPSASCTCAIPREGRGAPWVLAALALAIRRSARRRRVDAMGRLGFAEHSS